MKRLKIFIFILVAWISFSLPAFSQNITVSGIAVTGRFNSCNGNNTPTITANLISTNGGASVVGGNFICNNQCDSSTVRVTISNIRWNQNPNSEWLHGIFLPANAGFVVSPVALPAGFITYNPGCVGQCPSGSGTNGGPGFYFDNTAGQSCCSNVTANDGYPCNNYGNVGITCGNSFSMSFDIKFCNSLVTTTNYTFVFRGTSDGETGCWNIDDATQHQIQFTIPTTACAPSNLSPTATVPSRSCVNNVVNYTSTLTANCNQFNVHWWDAPVGGNLIGTGSPFVYDPNGSTCPAGTTLYATCCNSAVAGCVAREAIIIPGGCDSLNLTGITTTAPSCFGQGSINSVTVGNASGAVSYTLQPGNLTNTTGVFTGLTLNQYTVSVSDGSSCSITSLVTFTQPQQLVMNAPLIGGVTCSLPNSGTISISATGGLGAISYTISPNATQTTPGNFSGLSAQSYTITASDASLCSVTSVVTISLPPTVSWSSINTTNVACNGVPNGAIQVQAGGGFGAFTYKLMPGNVQNTTGTFTSLGAGGYTITATDANGCTATTLLSITQPTALSWNSVTHSNLTCFNTNTGSLAVVAIGGTAAITYQLLPANTSNATGVFTNLVATTYTVIATDANSCSISTSITLTQPTLLSITNMVTIAPSCIPGNNGSLTVTASGGVPAYTYILNSTTQSSNVFTNLLGGNYTITVKDANNCTVTSTFSMISPGSPAFSSVNSTNLTCNGNSSGTITVTATGSVGGYTYSILPGGSANTNGSFTGLAAGTYTVKATDVNSCFTQTVITLTAPPAISYTVATSTNVVCNSGNSGTITVSAIGGTGAISYTLLPPNTTNTTGIFTGLAIGSYTVVATDAIGCTKTVVLNIIQPPIVTWVSVTKINVACNGGANGSINATATGGVAPITYTISPGNISNTTGQFTSLLTGIYAVTATDANGCTTVTSVNLTQPSPMQVTNVNVVPPSCNPGGNGSMTITANGGTLPYNYTIGTGNQTNGNFSNLGVGTYTVNITDANNCTAMTVVNINVPNAPQIVNPIITNIACFGNNTGVLQVSSSGGTGAVNFTLQPGNIVNNSGNYTGLIAGTYTVSASDAAGCTSSQTYTLTQNPLLSWNTPIVNLPLCQNSSNGSITVQASGGNGTYTYVKQPGNVTNTSGIFSNLGGGSFTITVTDGTLCTASQVLNLTAPPALSFSSVTKTNVLCNGIPTGTVTALASGGSGVISYTLQPVNITNNAGTFSALAAGTYTVIATDANGCSVTSSISLTQPAVLNIGSISVVNASCIPGNNGSITVNSNGGLSPLNYSIGSGNQTNSIFTGLGAGIYTATVTDANGCSVTSTATIIVPNGPSITNVAMTQVTCANGTNGTATISSSGGIGQVNYTLLPNSILNNTGIFTGLLAGTYTISVSDANGCSATSAFTITQPAPISIVSSNATNITCNGLSNGTITIAATGGTGIISYTMNPGNITNTSGVFNGLGAANYTITVKDANQCSVSTLLNVAMPLPLTISNSSTINLLCYAGSEGQIQMTATGGTGTISYLLQPLNITSAIGTFTNLASNTYTVIASDGNACSISSVFTLTQPTQPIYNVTSTSPSCVPGNDGSITINVVGGTAPFNFTINGGNAQTSNTFTNLGAGTYTIVVSDFNDCKEIIVQTITSPNSPSITSTTATPALCYATNTGILQVTAAGGVGILSYKLLPGNIISSSGAFSNLAAGTYTVVVSDAGNCTISTISIITQPTIINWLSTTSTSVNCFGAANGSITVSATGGTGQISYNLTPGNLTNTSGAFTSLSAGTFTITAKDANNCTLTTSVVVTTPTPLVVSSASTNSVSCQGGNDGSLQVTANGGTGAISYVLQPGAVSSTTGAFTNLIAGTYTIQVSDANNCSIITTLIITQPTALQINSITSTVPSCIPGNDASMTITASGGTLNYQYSMGGPNQASNTFSNLGAGVFTVTVTDAKNCTVSSTIAINNPNSPIISSSSATPVSCFGSSNGSVTVTANGGTGILNYILLPGNVNSSNGNFTGLAAATYTVTVSDAIGCSMSTSITVTSPTPLSWINTSSTNVSCQGGSNATISVTANGGTGVLSYQLQPGGNSNTTGAFSGLSAGNYTITSSDANNCSLSTTLQITAPPALNWASVANTSVLCNAGNNGSITLATAGGTGVVNFTLQPGSITNSTGVFTNLVAATYTIIASDANGCSINTTVQINQPQVLQLVSVTSTIPSCVPGNDATLTITANGGTTNYQYSLGGPNQASNVFANLGAGAFTITVTDANACSVTSTYNISNPNSPIINTASATSVLCNGASHGSISVTASGGTGILNYLLQPGNTSSTSGSFTGLVAGNYTVSVTDAIGCSISTSLIINTPTQIIWDSTNVIYVNCFGGNNGSISTSASGGTGIITYTLQPGAVANTNGQFTSLVAGIYTISASDANNCSISTIVQITEPPVLAWATTTSTNVSCNAGSDASITVSAMGGSGTITFVLQPGNVSNTSGVLTNLNVNTYTILATDANGCSITTTIQITEPPVLQITSVVSTIPSCVPGSDAMMTITATGGTTNYQYSIGGPNQSSNVFSNLGPATYTVQVIDANACSVTSIHSIISPNAPVINSATASIVSCHGGSDAVIQVTANGGTGQLNYTMQPGAVNNTTGTFNGLNANTYSVTITDAIGCSISTVLVVTEPSAVVWDSTSMIHVSCFGGNNGSISTSASGGTGIITYTLQPGAVNNTNGQFTSLVAGTFTITASDANNCSISNIVQITEPPVLAWATATSTNVSCNAGSDASITVSATGGSGTITFVLQPGNVSNTSGAFSNLNANTYTILATDANGCSITTTIQITEPPVLQITSVVSTIPSCVPGSDAMMTITATGGTTNYQYSIGGPNQSSNVFSNLGPATYTVQVIDANACSVTSIHSIISPNAPVINSATASIVSCHGGSDAVIQVTANGGTGQLNYTMQPGAVNNTTGTFNGLNANTYSVTITDAIGCSISTVLVVTEPSAVVWDSTSMIDVSCFGGNNGSISTSASGGTGIITYTLQPGAVNNTNGQFTSLVAGIYTITASDANNCSISTIVQITEPPVLAWATTTSTNVSCNAGTDASITVSATGGSGTITFVLQPGNVSNTSGAFTNLNANTYTILATDANGCSITTTIQITEPPVLQITSVVSTIPSCVPGSDAMLTITATGGTTNYQYSIGGPNQSSNVFSNLGPATYTVLVTDANGCSVTSVHSIVSPNAPIIQNITATNASCDPGGDATADVLASGGNGALTYSIDGINFQSATLFTGLATGAYTIQVKDAFGCTVSSVITIINQPLPSVAGIQTTFASCVPGCDATAIITAIGGASGTYTYSLDGTTFQASSTFTNLCTSVYTVTIKDGYGCTASSLFTIETANGPAMASTNAINVNCYGGNDGSVLVTANGGTGLITYQLQPGAVSNTSGNFNGLIQQTYTITATDINGCAISTSISITQPDSLMYTNVTSSGSLCSGASNGQIEVPVSGGTGPMNYTISPTAPFTPPSTFTNLLGNTSYTITTTDAHNCSISTVIFVSQPLPIVIDSTSFTDVTCHGSNDGSLMIAASGGTGLLTYSIIPNAQSNTNGNFTSLNGNIYTVTVSDANNCTMSTLITVFEPSAITQTQLDSSNITCHNFNDGTIQWLCNGGVGNLTYNLQPGNITNTTGSFTNLSGNVYTLTATDTNNCSLTTQVTIINPDQIALDSVISTDVLCFGDVNGTVTAYGAGGTLPYTYTLLPINQSNGNGQFTGLGVNTYTVTLSDINNCSASTTTEIKQPAPLLSNLDSTKNVTCFGGNDGVIKVSAVGGTVAYQYKLLPTNTINSSGLFTSLFAGTYTVVVTDANACTTQVSSIVLTSPPQIVYTAVSHQDVVCFGDNTGSITVSAAGGTGAITFSLVPNTGFQSPAGNFTALYAGTYTVMATDAVGCTMSTMVVIDQNPELIFDSIRFTEPICYGDANGTLHAYASGGVGNLSYQLDNGNPQSNGLFTNLKAGIYRITITDIFNCKKDTLFQLTEPEPVHVNSLDLFPLSCIESTDGKVLVTGAGGRGNYTYYLRPGLHINRTGVFINLHDGIYTLTVKDSSGCTYDTAIVIAPAVNPMNLVITKQDLGCFGKGNEGWAQANIVGGSAPYTYLWSTNPVQDGERASGLYFGYYFLDVTDANGCKIKDTVYIEPGPCCDQVFIPNAFSPNGDGMNDEFRVTTSAGIELIQFEIYNRWGSRVWSTNDFRRGWDGSYHGDAQDMNTFYYILRYKCLTDGQKYMKKGDIMIVK